MSRRVIVKCTNCHHQTDAPDKVQHFITLYVNINWNNWNKQDTTLCLDFCSEGCRDDFINEHKYHG